MQKTTKFDSAQELMMTIIMIMIVITTVVIIPWINEEHDIIIK